MDSRKKSKTERFKENMEMIFTPEQIHRVRIKDDHCFVDVHGFTKQQCARFLDTIVKLTFGDFKVVVIHGYRNGTVLRDSIRNGHWSKQVASVTPDCLNPGRTWLAIA